MLCCADVQFAITALDVSLTAATWLLGLFSQPSGLAEVRDQNAAYSLNPITHTLNPLDPVYCSSAFFLSSLVGPRVPSLERVQ